MLDRAAQGTWNSTAGDRFEGNVASEGSGGAFFASGTKIFFKDLTSCFNNHAPSGGGGCVMWEPLAESPGAPSWHTRGPAFPAQRNLLSANTAAFGKNIATPPVSLRPIIEDADKARFTAPVGGGALVPRPRVEVLDF